MQAARSSAANRGSSHTRGWPEVKIGVGVNNRRMSVGKLGSEFRMSYTVRATR